MDIENIKKNVAELTEKYSVATQKPARDLKLNEIATIRRDLKHVLRYCNSLLEEAEELNEYKDRWLNHSYNL